MSEDLSLKFSVDSADAVAGVEAVTAAIDKTKTATATASVAVGELSGVLKEKLGPAGEAAFGAFEKLGNVQGLRGLSINIVQSQNAMEAFKKSVQDAEASGIRMPPAVGNAIKAMQSDIGAATQKLGDLRKSQQDLGATSALAGSQLDKLRQSGTSLTGMFDSMERTGTGLTKAIGQIGLSAGIAGAVFAGAAETGKVLGEALASLIDKHSKFMDVSEKIALTTQKYTDAQRLLSKGLIDTGVSVDELIAKYDRFVLSQGRGSEELKKNALGFTDAQMAATNYEAVIEKVENMAAAFEGQLLKTGQATEDLAKKTQDLLKVQLQNDALKTVVTRYEDLGDATRNEGEALAAVMEAEKKATVETFKLTQMALLNEGQIRKTQEAYRLLGQAMPESLHAALEILDRLKEKHDDMAAAMARAMVAAKNLPMALQKVIDQEKELADAAKLVSDSHDKIIPSFSKVLDMAGQGAAGFNKAALSLAAYAREHSLTAEQVVKMAVEQGRLTASIIKGDEEVALEIIGLTALGGSLKSAAEDTKTLAEQTAELGKLGDGINKQIDDRNKAIDEGTTATADYAVEQDRLNKAIADGSMTDDDIGRRQKNIDLMKTEAETAKNLGDAFGNLASKFGEMTMQADNAASGLQAVAWEMRKATPEAFTLTTAQNALIESLAKLSDAGGASSLWVGHLIAQLEKGEISFDQFTQKVNQLLQELTKMGPVMGNTAGELNAINTLLSNFKNTAGGGWPGGAHP